jgi:membrane-bound lytic murein transglycosylase A
MPGAGHALHLAAIASLTLALTPASSISWAQAKPLPRAAAVAKPATQGRATPQIPLHVPIVGQHGIHIGRHLPVSDLGRPPRPEIPGPIKFSDSQIEPIGWSDLDQWRQEDHAAALNVFRSGCHSVIGHAGSGTDARPVLPALAAVCRRAVALRAPTSERARAFFEENFRPVRILKLGDAAGFLTGYYEPVVEGSRFPTQIFKVPVYHRPPDLIPPPNYVKGQGFPNSGKSTRRAADGTLVPYYERGEIEDGALSGQHLEICWIKDPIDLLFIQIQGSARVRLEDGTVLRINYDSHNGHPYTAVGRILIERGLVARESMSMERIRQWMLSNPNDAKELRATNKSYVFFRVVSLSNDHEPSGAQGVPLTPGRSIAVDKALHVYGTPFFIEAELPINTPLADTKFRRLMVAQDTGSAIIGPARADLYFGAGDEAGRVAGRFRHPGRFAMLLPRELDPVAAGARFPLPKARPNVEELLARLEQERAATEARAQADVPLPPVRPPRPGPGRKAKVRVGERI